MPYGLDTDEVRFEVDAQGHKTRAIIPLTMYTALTEFWIAARRAQTQHTERTTRPGQFKGSLHAVKSGDEQAPADDATSITPFAHDKHWKSLIERLPDALDVHPPEAPPEATTPLAPPAPSPASPRTKQTFFAREFIEPIPDEVAALIRDGMPFLKAWRVYRKLSLKSIAELFGRSIGAVQTYDYGYNKPRDEALERFAIAFDCSVGQLTVKPGTSTAPWFAVIESPAPLEEHAPKGTAYPDGVRHSIHTGKSPLTAWRLYRGLSRAALATLYGARVTDAAITEMEEAKHLSTKTRAKLAKCLKCEPVQLLKPALDDVPPARTEAMMSVGR